MTDDVQSSHPDPTQPVSRLSRRDALLAGLSVTALTVVGAGRAGVAAGTDPTPRPTRTSGERAAVSLYFVSLAPGRLGPQIRPYRGVVTVDPTNRRVAVAALELLLAGPDGDTLDGGSVTAIPPGVRVVSADLGDDGTVRVELSAEVLGHEVAPELADRLSTPAAGQNDPDADRARRLALAQIVFTLTQFETIAGVDLVVDGEPVAIADFLDNPIVGPAGRDAFEDVTPLILIEYPLPLETVPAAVMVSGSANTFEASLFLRLSTDDGETLLDEPVQATSGSGTRGTFTADLTIPDGTAVGSISLLGYERSARDGSEVNLFEVPLRFEGNDAG